MDVYINAVSGLLSLVLVFSFAELAYVVFFGKQSLSHPLILRVQAGTDVFTFDYRQ